VLSFLNRNAGVIQAISAILTVLLALAALVGVKFQIDSAERIQREQSARDIYREYLNLSMSKPEFSLPNYCAIIASPQAPAYENFVEYVLYTAEQVMSVDEGWDPIFSAILENHRDYICQIDDTSDYTPAVSLLLDSFKRGKCTTKAKC
jgi:hypothetical protein